MSNFDLIDVVELLNKANNLGIKISLDDEKLKIKMHKDQEIDSGLLAELKLRKEHLISYFKKHSAATVTENKILPFSRDAVTHIPLSSSQERLWFLDQLEGSTAYHIPTVLRMRGKLDRGALEFALQGVVNRHEVLRTVIVGEDGKAYQHIRPEDRWKLIVIDDLIYKKDANALRNGIKELTDAPFDLSSDHMLRAYLIVLGEEEYVLSVVMHHIASDGWSTGIIVKELIEFYNASIEQRPVELPPLEIQYADYAVWQREQFSVPVQQQHLDYWKGKLGGVSTLYLPADYQRPAIQSSRGALSQFTLNRSLSENLQVLARQYDATLFMTLLTAFKVLLYRYTGQDDICVGTPTAGRTQQEVEGLVGFFVNTLALRSDLANNPSFETLLEQVKDTTLSAYQHQDLPLEKIVDAVVKERDLSRNPLFQVSFALLNIPEAPDLKLQDVVLSAEPLEHTKIQFDFTLTLREGADGLSGAIEYSTDLYREETISRMIMHFEQLLFAIVADPTARISELQLLSAAEEEQLLVAFNTTEASHLHEKGTTILDLFATRVSQTPDAIAIVFEDQSLTYKALDEKANQLAHYLAIKGVTLETMVPICLNRSLEMMVGILGIMKAGGAYVPIDPEYPASRISYILSDTAARVIITDAYSKPKLPQLADHIEVIVIDTDWDEIGAHAKGALSTMLTDENLAYVIYTSGSTGIPKGVMNQHNGIVNRLEWGQDYLRLDSSDVLLQKTTFCFDVSIWELFGPLIAGARLVFAKPEGQKDTGYLKNAIAQYGITTIHFVPLMLDAFLENATGWDGSTLRRVVCSGEALGPNQVIAFRKCFPDLQLYNFYGPTEAAIEVSYWQAPMDTTGLEIVPIGKPVTNARLYILDNHGNVVPLGVNGELHIGGIQVARGYLNRPDLTAEKFITDPFSHQPGDRLYKTGDLARWLPDGSIEYLGRMDDQVKIRGYRIELGEIENVLEQSELINQAVVLAKPDVSGNKRLVGYVVPAGDFDREGIILFLKNRLPEYMVPALWVALEEMPLTPNGKTDKKALPEPGDAVISASAYVPPRNEMEQTLTAIWQDLLGVSRVGIHDNFFELGGDSIVTIQVVSRAKRAGYELQPKDLFIYQTVEKLSALLLAKKSSELTAEQGQLVGVAGLLPIQQWFFEATGPNPSHFNQQVLLNIDKDTEPALMAEAIAQLVAYHDALRFTYVHGHQGWEQTYGTAQTELEIVDLQQIPVKRLNAEIERNSDRVQRSLDIERGILFRAVLLQTPAIETHNRLLLVCHHLAIDGVSWRIILEDMGLLLQHPDQPASVVLRHKSSSYRQWLAALGSYGQRRRLLDQLEHWEKTVVEYYPLRTEKEEEGIVTIADTVSHVTKLDRVFTRRLLQDSSRAYHTEINDLLLCALALTLAKWNGSDKVSIGLEGHGREDILKGIDTSRTVGWFTSLYPVLLEVKEGQDTGALIKSVKEQLRQVPDKGIGYGVLKYINKIPSLQGSELWDIIFNYLGQVDHATDEDSTAEKSGAAIHEDYPVRENLSVNSIVQGGSLVMTWTYSNKHFTSKGITELADLYLSNLETLIDHCSNRTAVCLTPSDYKLNHFVSGAELDKFMDENFNGSPRRTQVESMYRLSGLQEGMLFHSIYDGQAGAYVEQFTGELTDLDVPAFLQSWEYLLQHHSILRSGFYYDVFAVPVQCVYREVELPVTMLDYRHLNEARQAEAISEFEAKAKLEGFDFTVAPLMRITLTRLSANRYRLLWSFHHMLLDGWSTPVLLEKLLLTYEAIVAGHPVPVIAKDNYEDYIRYTERRDKEEEELYWRGYLKGISEGCLLPFVNTTADRNKGVGLYRQFPLRVNAVLSAQLSRFAQRHRVTVNTLMQGVWAYLLSRYTGRPDVVYGVTVSGRPEDLPGVERAIGMYINTLPLYTAVDGTAGIVQWLQELQMSQLQSREYQHTPLNITQRWATVEGDLFDSLLVFENYPVSKVLSGPTENLQLENAVMREQTNYPLSLIVSAGEEIGVLFSYNSSLLDETYVAAIAAHLEQVLQELLAHETGKLADIELLTASEKEQLLEVFNHTETVYPHEETAVSLFEVQVSHHPLAPAIVFEDKVYTYQELDERSNQLGRYLRSKGVTTDTLVPVCLERSAEMAVAILGIMKAGGAYVPVDPGYPEDRISFMLEDTQATVVVTTQELKDSIAAFAAVDTVLLDTDWKVIEKWEITAPLKPAVPGDLAYVIYTSGSTGKPKGVMIEHAGMLNHLYAKINDLQLSAESVVAFTASYTFDISVWQLFSALLCGGKTVIYSSGQILEPSSLMAAVEADGITILELVPSYLNAVLQENIAVSLQALRYLLVTGEAVSQPLLAQWFGHASYGSIPVVNAYGPTEASDDICHYIMHQTPSRINVPIGYPVQNMRIYVLSAGDQLCPVGVPGEICVSGIGVARGYLNRAELSASRFVLCPFEQDGKRMYRTGDLGRWLPDGTIEYLGRIDDQVKIRGFRIELGEIETILQQAAGVLQAAVVVKTDESGNKRLVAYVVSEGEFEREQTVSWLKNRLPEYMVPGLFVSLSALPLTGNGKIDRKGLPDPDMDSLQSHSYVAPRNAEESLLAKIWEELLHVSQVGIYDNFFELGGDSIITIQVVSRARRAGFSLHPRDLFVHQTIAGLSACLSVEGAGAAAGEQGLLEGISGLLPIQQHYLESGSKTLSHYNQGVFLSIAKSVDRDVLGGAIAQLVSAHDALRFTYQQGADGWEQHYGDTAVALEISDLREVLPSELSSALETHNDRYQGSLDLTGGIVFRAVLILTPEAEQANRLLLVVHHLAVDGVSWRILLEELEQLLNGVPLPPVKTASYRQWHQSLVDYGSKSHVQGQLGYWKKAVGQPSPLRRVQEWSGTLSSEDMHQYSAALDAARTRELLQDVPRAYHTVINDLLLSALALTLSSWNGSARVVIGLEGHGREDLIGGIDISRTVGWFTSLYPVVLEVESGKDTGAQLKDLKEQLHQVPDKGLGYGVLKYLDKAAALQVSDPWEVEFNYLGQLDNLVSDSKDTVLSGAAESSGRSVGEGHPVRELLSINSLIQGGTLQLTWSYSSRHFTVEAIAGLASVYLVELEKLIAHCVEVETPVFTPSDYNLGEEISNEELDVFLDAEYNGAVRRTQLESMSRLSGLQEGMLFHSLYDDQAGAYSKQFSCELVAPDVDAYLNSWNYLLKRHSILRSGFYHDVFKIPVQCVYREVKIPVTILDYRGLTKEEQKEQIRIYEEADSKKGFDFTAAPLMRICLIQLDNERYYMLWSHHHILLDGWSMPVLMEELLVTYEQLISGKPYPVLIEDRYEDYIRYIERQNKGEASAYWSKYLDGLEEASLLPFISAASDRTKGQVDYADEIIRFDAAFMTRLSGYVQQNRITVNTLMQGVWSYLLSCYTGRQDVAFGIVVSGRPENLPGIENAVGMYINTLPLHGKINNSGDIKTGLQQIQLDQLQSRDYQYTGLNEIQRLSGIGSELFDTLMVFENYPVSETLEAQPWKLQVENVQAEEHSNYPLTIIIVAGEQIAINFNYSSLLGKDYVKMISGHFGLVLEQVISSIPSKFGEIELLSAAERHQLLNVFNDTITSYPDEQTIIGAFREQVILNPEDTAIVYESVSLSYRELDERSEQLAFELISRGVKPESLVPVGMKRSLDMMIGILAILKAGAAYVPIDPDYPLERIAFMLEDTAGKVALTKFEWVSLFKGLAPDLELINLDQLELSPVDHLLPVSAITPDSPAYVIYTSGSTGQPKGVVVTHRNVVSLVKEVSYVALGKEDVLLSTGSPSFDATTFEYWGMLLNGGRLILCADDKLLDSSQLKGEIRSHGVTKMWFTSSWFNQLIDTDITVFEGLQVILAGGEKLSDEHVGRIRKTYPEIEIINGYGPTENTTFSLTFSIDDSGLIPIGRPLDNRTAYVLDAQLRLLPVGVPGEIYLGGAGLSLGYLNRPDLTAERFINHPFKPDEKIYKTGDIGRWLPDGNIEYLGRMDDQVKIRGYRIELGEIENVLQKSPLVRQAVVMARANAYGSKQLVGYIVPADAFDREGIVAYLKGHLPEYMIPVLWMSLDTLPLTKNGKVNKKALPEVEAGALQTNSYEAPRNSTEQALVEIWQELLRIEKVGIHDNFFELGGDSIITIQAVSRAKRAGFQFQPKDLFVYQTIAKLTILLNERKNAVSYAEEGFLTGESGLLPIQQWFFDMGTPSVSHFNQHLLLTVPKNIASSVISDAILQLVNYHDALRFTYAKKADGNWEQHYGNHKGELEIVNLKDIQITNLAAAVKDYGQSKQSSLDIEQGIIFRAVLFLTPTEEQENRLLLLVHHLAVDGVSWRILLEDLSLLIKQPGQPVLTVLGSKTASYRQWYNALKQYGQQYAVRNQQTYWTDVVKHYIPLPTDHVYTERLALTDTGTKVAKLNSRDTQRLLQEVPKAYHTEINDVLLCALAMALSEWSGIHFISVGLEGHGREDMMPGLDTSRTVGWFTNLYPVSLEIQEGKDSGYQLKSIKEQLRKIPEKGMSYGILKYLDKLDTLQKEDPWNVVFNYLGQLDNMVSQSSELGMATEQAGNSLAEDYPISDKLSVNTMIQGGELFLDWSYSSKHYEADSIERLCGLYMEHLQNLIEHCAAQEQVSFTPSDYGLNDLVTVAELDRFLDEDYLGKPRRAQIESIYRLGGLQEGMLFHDLYNEKGAFTEQLSCDLMSLQTAAFIQSWESLVEQHSILRTGFNHDVFSLPVQCVYKEVSLPVTLLDYRNMSSDEQEEAIREYEQTDRRKGFNLESAPLIRICLIQLSDDKYRLIWSFHHILLDGWSIPVLLGELLSNYELLETGKALTQQPVDRYEDYIRYIEKKDKEHTAGYWRNYLAQVEEGCLLPFVGATVDRTRGIGMKEGIMELDAVTTDRINNYAKQNHLTVNSVMQGVWAYLLYRYTGRQDVIYGVTVSGRPEDLPGIEAKVGLFINTLPLYIRLDHSDDITQWFQTLQQGQLENREYQYTTLNDIQRWTNIKGDLFDTSIVFQNYPISESDMQKGVALEVSDVVVHPQTNYPLTINVITGRETSLLFVYNDELLDEPSVEMMMGHFRQVLLQLVEKEIKSWSEVELLTPSEKELLLYTFNNKVVAYPHTQTLVDLFVQQAALRPESPALVFENRIWSYGELNERSGRLASYLRTKGVKADVLVPVYLERSAEMVVAILGIMKAGGAYVPLDTEYPAERISYILKDTAASIVVTTADKVQHLSIITDVSLVSIDGDAELIGAYPFSIPQGEVKPEDLAYVIYTSGSTGQPKGVMVEHAGMLNHLYAKINDLHLNSSSVVAFTASYTFDISVWQLFSALLCGGVTIIYPSQLILEPVALMEKIDQNGVTILELVPSYLTAVLRENIAVKLEKLEYLLVTGEAVSQPLLAQWFEHPDYARIPVINAYGPTEASDDICHYVMEKTPEQINIPLGSPIQNLQLYVFNNELNLCPVGVTGEICVAGIGVSRGYLNRPDLTAAKFITDPFHPENRMYRTGDLGRWLPDGNIEYLGRIDDQVKVRGFRIELGEIENVLQQYESISQAVVIVKADANGNKRLVAYLSAEAGYDKEIMLNWLKGLLPDYMVPSFFIKLAALPLTANGKIDKKALPDPDTNELLATAYAAPRNPLEEALAVIWQDMLGITRVGIYDNFFELGGLSLLVIGLVSVIKKELKVKLQVRDIFNYPTIDSLAAIMNTRKETGDDHLLLLNYGPVSFPVFMLPGAAGICEVYSALGHELNETCALYGLQMPGVFEGEVPLNDLPAIAALNIEWIKQVQPVGPYRFIGHSLGGIMLYEMTKQLEAAGEEVQTGIILDKDTTTDSSFHNNENNGEVLFKLAMLVFELGSIVTKPYPQWIEKLKAGLSLSDRESIMPVITSVVMDNIGNKKHYAAFILRILNLVISNAFLEYPVAGKVNASLLIVKATETAWEEKSGNLGWDEFASDVQRIVVPGDHDSILGKDHVQVLAAQLITYFQQFKG
ncbi:non-ribosomal peptide synthase/polyketide synthase [Pedobacter cryoconitis]|uniref:Amino acid adenylation domain-containing protein/non-ribosomal peptide synthase protein (TIGR01720 family) n=1 Tax=Pedobacter cryoconitis TaxID=188932 RepID=A0A7X0J035_9SPHI|nr:non-ribosomal peptide synthase/polyketide synthase [Pedobacter cryoconitis]MBB6498037.1 amino acid adenylation domain-containing protein/non-ribosomal peptide synthase protein (TIGR01720 family) [Pedobacter cryoconitis]